MQENLLGYLLGALDGDEQADIRERLEYDPQLREQLAELEMQLLPLEEERWQHDPPAGLAAATCKLVADSKVSPESAISAHAVAKQARQQARREGHEPAASNPTAQLSEWNPRKHGWHLFDAAIAAGIFAAAALLFFPAIANSRHQARNLACQNNLRLGNIGLSVFGEQNNGVLPYIPPKGKTGVAGFYAPQLVEGGFVNESSRFLCPSSQLASSLRDSFRVPTADEIHSASGTELTRLHQTMGGSYLYTLGHFNRGRHHATRNLGRSFFPVMADATSLANGEQVSPHGDHGVNVAFEDGHVRYIVGMAANHPYFVSDRGVIEAGSHRDDAVLGHSWARPQPLSQDGEAVETGAAMVDLNADSSSSMPIRKVTIRFTFQPYGDPPDDNSNASQEAQEEVADAMDSILGS